MNAPASFDKGRPGGHGGGGGHHGGKPHGGWNCCLFAKAYCKLPCYGKLCKENYSVDGAQILKYSIQALRPVLSSASPLAG